MRISVFGSGYVGLVVAACFAEVGHQVVCMDVDPSKIDALREGHIPIYEPGLEEIIKEAQKTSHLVFTTDPVMAAKHGECQFIAVGTPPDEQGKADLSYVSAVAKTIGQHMDQFTIVVNKSTVPIGTADLVEQLIQESLTERQQNIPFAVVSNPEFLKQGAALEDFRKPNRVVVGVQDPIAEEKMRALYAPFLEDDKQLMVMDKRSAEFVKYAANSMLATKISFMNEMANIAEKVGADIEKVRQGIGADPRIGYHFIHPGCGYGGSCFGKDIQALIHTAQDYQCQSDLINSVEKVNRAQKIRLFEKIQQHYHNQIAGKTFALWGLSFKPETDDMRDAPSLVMLNALFKAGAKVQAFDPQAMYEAKKIFGNQKQLQLCHDPEEALEGADGLIVLTEWRIFRSPNWDNMKSQLRAPVIFDGRNIFDPAQLKTMGFTYYGIGR